MSTKHAPPSSSTEISTVNLAARQRMLSQRLVLQILLAAKGQVGQAEAAAQTLALFSSSQAQLRTEAARLQGEDARTLAEVYAGEAGGDRQVGEFVERCRQMLERGRLGLASDEAMLESLVACIDPVLAALNSVTGAFDRISVRKEAELMQELREIVGDIQSVAREAKVVSFNAQVIAARAGTVGREFAVVASTLSRISGEVDGLARKGLTLAQR